jgi:hypothetical protein
MRLGKHCAAGDILPIQMLFRLLFLGFHDLSAILAAISRFGTRVASAVFAEAENV